MGVFQVIETQREMRYEVGCTYYEGPTNGPRVPKVKIEVLIPANSIITDEFKNQLQSAVAEILEVCSKSSDP